MTTYWAQTLSLLLTVIFLLTFEQKLKVLKMPAPTIQAGSAARPDVGRRLEHLGRLQPLAELGSYLLNLIHSCWLNFPYFLKYGPPQPEVVQGKVWRRCWPLRLTKPRDDSGPESFHQPFPHNACRVCRRPILYSLIIYGFNITESTC